MTVERECYVDVLVAKHINTGAPLLVLPTTLLTDTLTGTAEELCVTHNCLVAGDIVYLCLAGAHEYLRITSAARGLPGAYRHTVERDQGATGCYEWPSNSAVVVAYSQPRLTN